jgi:hypothetical protein
MISKEQPLSGKHYDMISDLLDACRTGRIADLLGLLREDIQLLADHREEEGKEFLRMVGLGQCSKFLKAIFRSGKSGPAYTIREIAGRAAAIFREPGRAEPDALLFFEKEGRKLSRIYCFRHPERIRRHLAAREFPGMRPEERKREVEES